MVIAASSSLEFLAHPEKTAAFTGHRPEKAGGYDGDSALALEVKGALFEMVQVAKASGYRYFISGMALGVDQWAAEIVLADPELVLVAAVPCPGQAQKWRPVSQALYRRLLERAGHVEEVSKEYTPAVMQVRNIWMVDRSSLLLAIWNGDLKGGTFNCVKYAVRQKREILRYNPADGTVGEVSSL